MNGVPYPDLRAPRRDRRNPGLTRDRERVLRLTLGVVRTDEVPVASETLPSRTHGESASYPDPERLHDTWSVSAVGHYWRVGDRCEGATVTLDLQEVPLLVRVGVPS